MRQGEGVDSFDWLGERVSEFLLDFYASDITGDIGLHISMFQWAESELLATLTAGFKAAAAFAL